MNTIERYVQRIMEESAPDKPLWNIEKIHQGKINGWNYIDGCMMTALLNMYYFCDPDGHEEIVWSKEKHPVDDSTPYLGSFLFRDMECTDCEWAAGYFYGLTEQPIGSVTIENVNFTFKEDAAPGRPAMMDYIDEECKRGLYFNYVDKVVLKNVTMTGQDGERLTAINVGEVIDQ